ncbi:MAG: hypothetical protein H7Y13_04145 [Sphingobacteriaceae bacterium]|nr:hypothetical protein [Sphingobacteriaceae bacterium]
MRNYLLRILPVVAIYWVFPSALYAQHTPYEELSKKIDSLANLGLPKSAWIEIEKLEKLARKEKNTVQQLKAAIYRVTFQEILQGNNQDSVFNSIKQEIKQAQYPVKPVLQSVLAGKYWAYYQRNRYKINQRTTLEKPDEDFLKWDIRTFINEISNLYKLSLKDAETEQKTPVSTLTGVLAGDSVNRYLRPTLYDLLAHRALDFFLSEESDLIKPKLAFALNDERLFSSSKFFIDFRINQQDTASTAYQGVRLLQKLSAFHLRSGNRAALADIDLKRLEFVFRKAVIANKDSLYLSALHQLVTDFSQEAISADALLLLAKYYKQKEEFVTAVEYLSRAIKSFPQSRGGVNAVFLLENIKQTRLFGQVEEYNVPEKPILASVQFANLKSVKVKVYKVSAERVSHFTQFNFGNENDRMAFVNSLSKLKPVQYEQITLPIADDYKSHTTEIALPALPIGHYLMILETPDDSLQLHYTSFQISNLAYVVRQNSNGTAEIRVMDRTSGKPLKNVEVFIESDDGLNDKLVTKGRSDINGKYVFASPGKREDRPDNKIHFLSAKDTLSESSYLDLNIPTETTTLFTDRNIYRPGQTIYFKGIEYRWINGEVLLGTNKEVELELLTSDDNNIGSLKLKTNEFGTFSGSFVLPTSMRNGTIVLKCRERQLHLRVEEYKRPTFEAKLLPLKQAYHFNDLVKVRGLVTAYSGYGLSNVQVVYRIVRQSYSGNDRWNRSSKEQTILIDTLRTNKYGEFVVNFTARKEKGTIAENHTYTINADITDAAGETHSVKSSVDIREKVLDILTDVPKSLISTNTMQARIAVNNLSAQFQKSEVRIKIYSLKGAGKIYKKRLWQIPDLPLYTQEQFFRLFPDYPYKIEDDIKNWAKGDIAIEKSITTDTLQVTEIDLAEMKTLPAGMYRLEFYARNSRGDTASSVAVTNLVNPDKPKEIKDADWVIPVKTDILSGEAAKFILGTNEECHILMEIYEGQKIVSQKWIHTNGQPELVSTPKLSAERPIKVQFLRAYHNRVYASAYEVKIQNKSMVLNMMLSNFRNKLEPGAKERWQMQITTKGNEKQAVELAVSMYDASLDAFNRYLRNNWPGIPSNYRQTVYSSWENYRPSASSTRPIYNSYYGTKELYTYYERLAIFSYNQYLYRIKNEGLTVNSRDATVSSFTVNAKDLEELSAASIDQSLQGRMPGVDIPSLNQTILTPRPKVLASNASVSDSSPDIIPLRKNFNETAFFYPQLRTNENGETLLEFTMPDALTRWKFRGYAHTKDLKYGYIERELVTQKSLMISANTPRFFREGDTITVSARIANLNHQPAKVETRIQLYNALTMQPVELLTDKNQGNQTLEIAAASTSSVSFKMIIPKGLDAITYRLTARTEKFSDGEENTIPVLPNSTLVTESMPLMVRAGQTKNFTFNRLVGQTSKSIINKTLTFEYTQNPVWYAVQALPYLMEYPYECSEQTFSRYFANKMAQSIVAQQPRIKAVFDNWKSLNSSQLVSNLETNPELKSVLIEETPWLRNANNETEQKKRIALLFDLNKMSNEAELNLSKLAQMQMPEGGFPWFSGSIHADRYITQYILSGLGQLKRLNLIENNMQTRDMITKGIAYLDGVILSDYHDALKPKLVRENLSLAIHALYARSFYSDQPGSLNLQPAMNYWLARMANSWNIMSIHEKGMIGLLMNRYKRPQITRAILRSLIETSQQSDELGMYWVENRWGYYWHQSPIETQSLLIELFTEAGGDARSIDEMKIWLLRNKQTTNWKTTKATTAACYSLLMKGADWLASDETSELSIGGNNLSVLKPDIKAEAGSGYLKTSWSNTEIKPDMGKIEIKNPSKVVGWGAMHWQYLEQLDKITSADTQLKLERKYFIQRQTESGPRLTVASNLNKPKTGDLLKVVVYLNADRDYEYIHLKDMRPSGTEPTDVLSGYKYQENLYYYQVTKDVATNFFINYLPKGNYVFEYSLRVVQPGNFSTGISSVQSLYAPEFNAHSQGLRMIIE